MLPVIFRTACTSSFPADTVSGPEVERLDQAFLERGSVERLDLSEVERLTLPPLVLPETSKDD